MSRSPASVIRWLFDSAVGASDRLIPRWIFLRALGLIYFSAFYALVFQIRGLIGPDGILPADEYLEAVTRQFGQARFWFAPTVLWLSSGGHMLAAICWIGMIASVLLVLNVWPRVTLLICFVCFLSFVAAAQDFSGYQSDGMLLEAGFISLFFAPAGLWPGLGRSSPPSRASLFLLQWEWFRIYFESGMVKLAGGDIEWRNFTAMDEYYQNGPLPTWVGWYMQHLPHGVHAFATGATLVLELGLVFMLFLPRRWRIACFFIVTLWQIPVILTANYTFLNYLVLVLGFLLLDDRFILRYMPARWQQNAQLFEVLTQPLDHQPEVLQAATTELQRRNVPQEKIAELNAKGEALRVQLGKTAKQAEQKRAVTPFSKRTATVAVGILALMEFGIWNGMPGSAIGHGLLAALAVPLLYAIAILLERTKEPSLAGPPQAGEQPLPSRRSLHPFAAFRLALTGVMLTWIFYATTVQMIWMLSPRLTLPTSPVAALEPFRIANRYGLFAVMTRGRYEIEFQGSDDGQNWKAYPFLYKPQELDGRPRIYAPYQPRFDWNLWFASFGTWRDNIIVPSTEERLLDGAPDVLALFAGNPFPQAPPKQVRAVLWQYWFTTMAEKRATGMWWRRKLLGLYAPVLEREADGKVVVVEWPEPLPPHL